MPPRERKRQTWRVNQPSDSLDLISALPDELLASALSLLPIKDSARTSILSSRWRHLWSLSSLDLEDSSLLESPNTSDGRLSFQERIAVFEKYKANSREIVSRIISIHSGPIRRCCLSFYENTELYPTVDGLVEILTQRGIEELHLRFYASLYKLPTSLVFCKSLTKLTLVMCCFIDPPFSSACFPNLKDLHLTFSFLSKETIHCLFTLCLESLELCGSTDANLIRVSSRTLCKLWLKFYWWDVHQFKSIVIKDAPNLKQLMLQDTMEYLNSFIVQHAPNLGLLAFEVELVHLGRPSLSPQPIPTLINISSMLPSVKTLAVKVNFSDVDTKKVLPAFLRYFPCLESLNLLLFGGFSTGHDIHWEKLGPFDFVEHLKTVTIKNFEFQGYDVEFARFLVLNSRVLRKMTLLYSKWSKKELIAVMSHHLCLADKASPELEVTFLKDSYENSGNTSFVSLWNQLSEQF